MLFFFLLSLFFVYCCSRSGVWVHVLCSCSRYLILLSSILLVCSCPSFFLVGIHTPRVCAPERCGVCDMVFDREDKMQMHQATHVRGGNGDLIRPFSCNVQGCGKAFTEKRNLNAHRRTNHTEVTKPDAYFPGAYLTALYRFIRSVLCSMST